MFISLVIPVYNVEKYIDNCIKSCLEQNIKDEDYEIIIINDGTKDKSMDIVDIYYKQYPNLIKIYNQENKGLSAARNSGLNMACGDYVWFIDSDDWITTNCLTEIRCKLFNENPDILALCAADIINDKTIRRNTYDSEITTTGKYAFNKMISPCAPFVVYKRTFLLNNKLFFYEGIYHEDSEFMPKVYYHANKVSYLNTIVYNINQNPDSITRTVNPKKAFDILTVCKSLDQFSKTVSEDCKKHLSFLISMNLNTALSHSYTMDTEYMQKLNDYIYKHHFLFRHLKHSKLYKYKIEYILFNIFPHNTVQLYKFLQFLNLNKNNRDESY